MSVMYLEAGSTRATLVPAGEHRGTSTLRNCQGRQPKYGIGMLRALQCCPKDQYTDQSALEAIGELLVGSSRNMVCVLFKNMLAFRGSAAALQYALLQAYALYFHAGQATPYLHASGQSKWPAPCHYSAHGTPCCQRSMPGRPPQPPLQTPAQPAAATCAWVTLDSSS